MSVGLVLEGGGMRGIFTAGVLDFFLDRNISFDTVIGVSAGSCHGCSFVSRQRGRALAVGIDYLDDKDYCGLYSLIRTGDLFGADFCYRRIPDELYPFDHKTFEESSTKFYAVVTDCETGEAVYQHLPEMHSGVQYVRASSSMPLVSRMVELDGHLYLDGGMADSIPIRQSQSMGNVKNVVVLTQPKGYRKKPSGGMALVKAKYRHYPALVKDMAERHIVYNETLDYLAEQEAAGDVFVIRPPKDLPLGRVEKDKDKLKLAYNMGYREAERRFNALRQYLNK